MVGMQWVVGLGGGDIRGGLVLVAVAGSQQGWVGLDGDVVGSGSGWWGCDGWLSGWLALLAELQGVVGT